MGEVGKKRLSFALSEMVWRSLSPSASFPFLDRNITDVVRLGLEGLITFKKDTHEFDAENYVLNLPRSSGGTVTVGVFDKVMVDVWIEKDGNTQRGKVCMGLVEPVSSEGL